MIEVKSLKEIASFIRTGKTPPTKQEKYFNGEINWYSPGDLDKTKFLFDAKRTITQLAIEDKKAITYPENTLLIGCIGNIGKLGITSELSSSNQQLTGVLPNDNTDVNYLYYWFHGNKKVLESYSNNAVVPILNNRTLETIKIPLPPLDQQKKIAAILDAADAYIQKTKALITKYEELTQSLFLDMFGDPVTNPKRWDEMPISKSIDLIIDYRGKTPPKSKSGIPLLSSANVQDGRIDLSREQYISKENYKNWIVRGLTNPGDLLFTTEAPITEVALIPNDGNIYQISRRVMALRFINNQLNNYFALHLMLQKNWSDRLKKLTRGSTVPRLLKPDILKQLLILPPIELQNQFADRVQAIEIQKVQAQASLAQAEDLFNSLLQRAFKGELV